MRLSEGHRCGITSLSRALAADVPQPTSATAYARAWERKS